MACVGVAQTSALGIEDGVEAGDEHVGWDVGDQGSLTRSSTSPGRVQRLGRRALSMLRVLDITRAAGTPLPVASPTTSPSRPSERRWKS